MPHFWKSHPKLSIVGIAAYGVMVLLLLGPYIMPLGRAEPEISAADLMSSAGMIVDIDGLGIYVEDYNPQSRRETLVFIHGLGGSSYSWRLNIPYFASLGFRVITLDLKGFGLSYKDSASDYSHPAQAKMISALLDKLAAGDVFFVGHSMGASVMFHFTQLFPDRVSGMISVCGAINLEAGPVLPAKLSAFGPFNRAARVVLTNYLDKERIYTIMKSAYHVSETVTEEVVDNYYNRLVMGRWHHSLMAMTRDMPGNTVTFRLEEWEYPLLVLMGEYDSWVSREATEQWLNQLASAQVYVIPGTGHMPMEEAPEVFNARVLDFLESN